MRKWLWRVLYNEDMHPTELQIFQPHYDSTSPNVNEPPHDKTNKHVRPVKTQTSLGIHPIWSESLLSAWRKLGFLAIHWAHSEDSDQTGRMPRLIRVFAGRTCQYVGFVTKRLKCFNWLLCFLPKNLNYEPNNWIQVWTLPLNVSPVPTVPPSKPKTFTCEGS